MKDRPNILFINTPEPDYLQDLSYSGLVKILGREQVVDFPWNPHFHLPTRSYPRNLGRTGFAFPKLAVDPEKFDLVMIGSAKPKTFATYLGLAKKFPGSTPVVFIDGGDWSEVGGDLRRLGGWDLYQEAVRLRPFYLVFKREMLLEGSYPEKTFPLPFSFNFDRLPPILPQKMKYQVSFWAVESHPIRSRALEMLEDKFDCRANGTVRHQVFSRYQRKGRRYLEELAACAVVINLPGAGWDTMRYWEVPALGRFLISMKPRIFIPDDFDDGREIVFCRQDISDLIDLCRYYLDNPEKREAIARAASAKAREKHSDIARAWYIMNVVHQYL